MFKTELFRHFISDKTGSIGPIFGLALVPAVASIALAVDFSRVSSLKSQLQQISDTAALAAGSAVVSGSDADKQLKRLLLANSELDGLLKTSRITQPVRRIVSADTGRIGVKLSTDLETTLGKAIYSSFGAVAQSTATIRKTETKTTSGAPVCLLALNPTAVDAVKFWGTSDLIAPTCVVQGNSTTAGAFNIGGSATATAAAFCTAAPSAGGTAWSPAPTLGCPPLSDPFAGKYTVSALQNAGINVDKSCDEGGAIKPADGATLDAGLYGGVYRLCAGLTVMANRSVTLKPGVYVINGALSIGSGGTLNAPGGVTFFFAQGASSGGLRDGYLNVQGGASLVMQAPTTGPLAGIAMAAPTAYSTGSTHTLIGGGTIDIVGMIYVPKGRFYITGNGAANQVINARSRYFGIISDTFLMQGNGQIALNGGNDVQTYAMPSMPANTRTETVETRATLVE